MKTVILSGYKTVYDLLTDGRSCHGLIAMVPRVIGKISLLSSHLRWLTALSLAVVSLVMSGCSEQNEAERPRDQPLQVTQKPTVGGTYRRPLANDPTSLDPAKLVDLYGVAVANQIFEGLVEFDSRLNVMPALAHSWSASPDGLVWKFNLHKGVQFHNGREMSAEDVVYSLSRLLDPTVHSPRSWFLDKMAGAAQFQAGTTQVLDGIKAMDRYTVQITLSEPFAPFISILGLPHTSIVPREEIERSGADFATEPVGTGPFRFVKWDRGREIVVEANTHYFRGRPALDRVQFVIFPGGAESDMLHAFERGELEESPLIPARRREVLAAGSYSVMHKPTLNLRLLGFNCERPPFDRREVRQAFNYAMDKIRINQGSRQGQSIVARSILPPGMPGYNPEVQSYSYDPAKAKQLLAQAGYPDGKNFAPVTLATSRKSSEEILLVQQALAAIGLTVEFQQFEDWTSYQAALQKGDVQLFTFTRYADYPDPDSFLYPLFHSKSQTNYFRYYNPTVDTLLDDARRETNDLRRVDLYRQAEQIILSDAPVVTLFHYTYDRVFQPYVEGVEVSALGDPYVPLSKVWLKRTGQANAKK